jgi:hypothetical protein
MMNCLPIEETKMGTNYELIDNLSKSDVPKHTSQDWFISYRRVMALFRAGSLTLAIETGMYAKRQFWWKIDFALYAIKTVLKLKTIFF